MASNPENSKSALPLVELFTDGSCCHGNPGPGGWAFILRHENTKIERVVAGGIGYTTNERMEMIAVINGLRSLKRACRVTLFTDSQTVVNGIKQRVAEWKQLGWRKSMNSKKIVQNADLWMHLAKQCTRHTIDARWVKGHAGHVENERCDKLARGEARKAIEKLENSAQKDVVGADAMLADWISAASSPVSPSVAAPRSLKAAQTMPLFPQPVTSAPADPIPQTDGPIVHLFTDGACIGNPGPGGWAFILRHRTTKTEKTASGGVARTTNNRMELLAVIQGLMCLRRACRVDLVTDSQYVSKGITEWAPKWKKFGWRKTVNAKLQVRNADLWARLDELSAKHTIVTRWVRGHAGHCENERCDQLAQREAEVVARNPNKAPLDTIEAGED